MAEYLGRTRYFFEVVMELNSYCLVYVDFSLFPRHFSCLNYPCPSFCKWFQVCCCVDLVGEGCLTKQRRWWLPPTFSLPPPGHFERRNMKKEATQNTLESLPHSKWSTGHICGHWIRAQKQALWTWIRCHGGALSRIRQTGSTECKSLRLKMPTPRLSV